MTEQTFVLLCNRGFIGKDALLYQVCNIINSFFLFLKFRKMQLQSGFLLDRRCIFTWLNTPSHMAQDSCIILSCFLGPLVRFIHQHLVFVCQKLNFFLCAHICVRCISWMYYNKCMPNKITHHEGHNMWSQILRWSLQSKLRRKNWMKSFFLFWSNPAVLINIVFVGCWIKTHWWCN